MRWCLTLLICAWQCILVTRMVSGQETEAPVDDRHGGVAMGPSPDCDDGLARIEIDWDPRNATPYTCPGNRDLPTESAKDLRKDEHEHLPLHRCMNISIDYMSIYGTNMPSSGEHRPVWPTYGTYTYVPPQRWLHSMEHGGIVALYHPCAKPELVDVFTSTVKSCLRRYIISPYPLVNVKRPFVLLAWQRRLEMNSVNPEKVKTFIKKHALQGPEVVPNHGGYHAGLIAVSEVVSDFLDSQLCPDHPIQQVSLDSLDEAAVQEPAL